jgi:hypothetical protein
MVNRKGFAAMHLIIAGVVMGVLLIISVAVPNVLRQTRNSSRTQDIHLLGLLVKDQQLASQTGLLPSSCNNTQPNCFSRLAKLSFYENTSNTETVVTYYRNPQQFNRYSPQLNLNDKEVADKVYIHTYATCDYNTPTGHNASMNSVIIQYAIETFTGPKLVCKIV